MMKRSTEFPSEKFERELAKCLHHHEIPAATANTGTFAACKLLL